MGESDGSDERPDLSRILERIGRRKLIVGAVGGLTGALIISDQYESHDQITPAENQFFELAESLNDADLKNPQQSPRLHDKVVGAVDSVGETLDQVSPEDPQTEERISVLNAALEYYTELGETLGTATSLLGEVSDSELAVLHHQRDFGNHAPDNIEKGRFEESIGRLSQAEKEPAAVTSEDRKLVPDQEQVVESLRAQAKVYELHITAQQSYLDTATSIESGMRAHEQSRFDTARSKLGQARGSLTDAIPTTNYRYRLFHTGLSLDQYAKLLDLRRKGVVKLLETSNSDHPEQNRRSVSDEAVDFFFEARRVVTSRS